MKIPSIIVDDELSNRNLLRLLLNKFCPEVELIGEAENATSAFELIQEKKPLLVFLDIQMPKGNGFSLLKKFDTIPFMVIFVTSYDQYAITAIKFSALDYLLKPIEVSELKLSVNRAQKLLLEKSNQHPQILNLLQNTQELEPDKNIAIHDKGKVRFVKLKELVVLEAQGNYSDLVLETGEKILTTKTLKDIEDLLENHPLFLRINKSCIVNVNFIKDYSKKEPMILSLANGMSFEISRRKRHEVNERLKHFSTK